MSEQKLPDAELEVLSCLQRCGEASARQLREAMQSYRPMAHGSMLTLLKRLEGKGLVQKEKGPVGKAFIYTPVKDSRATSRPMLKKMVSRIFGGSNVALISSLFETQPPTVDEITQLENLLGQLRKQSGKKGKKS